MIEFLISLLIAFLTGTISVSGASSISSEDLVPQTSIQIEWPGHYIVWGTE